MNDAKWIIMADMKPQDPSIAPKTIHFVGIGGIGVSALARYFLAKNWAVSGSDAAAHTVTEGLKKHAINVKIGHKSGNVPKETFMVVKSQAVPDANPELREARRRGIKVLTYPEALGEVTRRYKTIAIAGSHGKSTTTALAALTLIRGGLDPTVIVGTNLTEFGNENFREGKGGYLILEADEYGRAFHNYSPFVAIVTNIDREHLDVYPTLADGQRAFMKVLGNTVPGGALILTRDDANLFALRPRIEALAARRRLRVMWYSLRDASVPRIAKKIKIFGAHNLSNAEAVATLGKFLKIPDAKVLAAIGAYRGAWRRMEYRGTMALGGGRTAVVYDDYAHHPTEIRATLRALRERFPKRFLMCVFQPHQGERLTKLFEDFATAFSDANAAVLLPHYKVKGRDHGRSKTSADLAAAVRAHLGRPAAFLADPEELPRVLKEALADAHSPLIVMMGAGTIVNYTERLVGGAKCGDKGNGAMIAAPIVKAKRTLAV